MSDCDHQAVSRCAKNCDCDPELPHRCRTLSCWLCGVPLKWNKEHTDWEEVLDG